LSRLEKIIAGKSGLDLRRDDGVVDVLSRTLMCRRRCAAGKERCNQCQGHQIAKEDIQLLHGGVSLSWFHCKNNRCETAVPGLVVRSRKGCLKFLSTGNSDTLHSLTKGQSFTVLFILEFALVHDLASFDSSLSNPGPLFRLIWISNVSRSRTARCRPLRFPTRGTPFFEIAPAPV
jgi:hypothetical protein